MFTQVRPRTESSMRLLKLLTIVESVYSFGGTNEKYFTWDDLWSGKFSSTLDLINPLWNHEIDDTTWASYLFKNSSGIYLRNYYDTYTPETENKDLYNHDVGITFTDELVIDTELEPETLNSWLVSSDLQYVAYQFDVNLVYRHSSTSKWNVYEISSKKLRKSFILYSSP